MHNTGKVALEYSWEEAANSKAWKDPYLIPEMRQFLFVTLKYRKSMLEYIKWCQERPFQRCVEMWELIRLPRDSEQQQQQEQPEQQGGFKKIRIVEDGQLYLRHGSLSLEFIPDVQPLFSISSHHGTITPGKKQTFHVQFYPMSMGKFMTTMLCRIPNLEPTWKKVRVIVKGRARERKSRGKLKHSTLLQAEKGQRPNDQVHLKPTSE